MSAGFKPFAVRTSGVLAAVAALALSLGLGGTSAARADEPQAISAPAEEMTLVPAKSIEALEQRIAFLEEQVTSLTQAWQHIDTHRICVSDAKGEGETCLTKPELDALLTKEAPVAEAKPAVAEPPAVAEAKPTVEEPPAVAAAPPTVEPVESVATVESTEPPAAVVASETPKDEQDLTGSIKPAAPAPEAAELEHPAEEGNLH